MTSFVFNTFHKTLWFHNHPLWLCTVLQSQVKSDKKSQHISKTTWHLFLKQRNSLLCGSKTYADTISGRLPNQNCILWIFFFFFFTVYFRAFLQDYSWEATAVMIACLDDDWSFCFSLAYEDTVFWQQLERLAWNLTWILIFFPKWVTPSVFVKPMTLPLEPFLCQISHWCTRNLKSDGQIAMKVSVCCLFLFMCLYWVVTWTLAFSSPFSVPSQKQPPGQCHTSKFNPLGERKSEKSLSLGVVWWFDGTYIPKSWVCVLLVTKNQELFAYKSPSLKVVKATLCERLTYVTYMMWVPRLIIVILTQKLIFSQTKFFINLTKLQLVNNINKISTH